VGKCCSATETSATTTATTKAAVSTAATTATATASAAVAAGQAVDAGACRVGLTAGANGIAVGQIQARELGGFQGIDVAWQLVAIAVTAVVTAALTATCLIGAAPFRTWTVVAGSRATLAVTTVVKTRIATLFLTTTAAFATAVTTTFAATIALAFKAGCALWAIAA